MVHYGVRPDSGDLICTMKRNRDVVALNRAIGKLRRSKLPRAPFYCVSDSRYHGWRCAELLEGDSEGTARRHLPMRSRA